MGLALLFLAMMQRNTSEMLSSLASRTSTQLLVSRDLAPQAPQMFTDLFPVYANEESVGIAIKESGLPRDQLYITTKYDGGDIHEAIDTSLSKVCMRSPRIKELTSNEKYISLA